jgi:hypothetical protein
LWWRYITTTAKILDNILFKIRRFGDWTLYASSRRTYSVGPNKYSYFLPAEPLSIEPTCVVSIWKRRQNPVSETSCYRLKQRYCPELWVILNNTPMIISLRCKFCTYPLGNLHEERIAQRGHAVEIFMKFPTRRVVICLISWKQGFFFHISVWHKSSITHNTCCHCLSDVAICKACASNQAGSVQTAALSLNCSNKEALLSSYSMHSFMKMGPRQRRMKDISGTLQLPQKSKHHTVQTCKSLGPQHLVTDAETPNSIPDETTKLTNLMLVTNTEIFRLCLFIVFQLT